jgi:hypothetical protein
MTQGKKAAIAAGILLAALGLSSTPASATAVIAAQFDGQPFVAVPGTLNFGLGIQGPAAAAANGWSAESIGTSFISAGNYFATQLDLGFFPDSLSHESGSPPAGGFSDLVTVSLQSYESGNPGQLLGSWTQNVPQNGLLQLPGMAISLNAGATYFLSVQAADPNTDVNWLMSGSSATSPIFYDRGQGWLPADSILLPNGLYDLVSQGSVAFDVLGEPSPVPLPGALWLLLSGITGMTLLRGSKLGKSSA